MVTKNSAGYAKNVSVDNTLKMMYEIQKRELIQLHKDCSRKKDWKLWFEMHETKKYGQAVIKEAIDYCNKIENRLKAYKDSFRFKVKIRGFCNEQGWTDVYPYEVVRVITDKCVEIREMKTEAVYKPKEFYPGGFSGHFADNHAQTYNYFPNKEAKSFRIRLCKSGWKLGHRKFYMSDKPYKFHDYNF